MTTRAKKQQCINAHLADSGGRPSLATTLWKLMENATMTKAGCPLIPVAMPSMSVTLLSCAAEPEHLVTGSCTALTQALMRFTKQHARAENTAIPEEHGLVFQVQDVAHLQEHCSQSKDVDLQHIRDVNQHEGLLLLPTEDVQASACYLRKHAQLTSMAGVLSLTCFPIRLLGKECVNQLPACRHTLWLSVYEARRSRHNIRS